MGADITQEMLLLMKADVNDLVLGVARAINTFDDLGLATQKNQKSLGTLGVAFGNLLAKISFAALQAPGRAFNFLTQKVGEFVAVTKDATMVAARLEVQWRTLALTAGNAGKTFAEVKEYVLDLRMAGIKTGEALQAISSFLANRLPLENVAELARRAQDMAVVIGKDSTEAFARFNTFLQTGNSEFIRTMGITKTATQMLKEYADAQGLVVDSLTKRQRGEALVQGLMEATAAYAGAYEEAMKDPYKRWTSLPRLISNVVEALGGLFVPAMGAVVDVASEALEILESLFRVTKKEAKETGAIIGEWKDGFLRLRAVVQVFSDWIYSLWNRMTGGFREAGQSFMDNFVGAIVRGVQTAANALRSLARFMAQVFGGKAPGAVTAAGIAATRREAEAAAEARAIPEVGALPDIVGMADPAAYEKLMRKPVPPASLASMEKLVQLRQRLGAAMQRFAAASSAAAKARKAFAKSEERLAAASEKVWLIRERLEDMEREWAEIPERFIRGRRRQMAVELDAAQDAEHERQKERKAERARLSAAEIYEREMKRISDALRRDADKVGKEIERQNEKYAAWLEKLNEAAATVTTAVEQPVQGIVAGFESLDDLVAPFMEEVEGPLTEAFADIELSVASIAENLTIATGKVKEFLDGIWQRLVDIKAWWDELPDWAQDLLKGAVIVGLGFKLLGGAPLSALITAAFSAAGLIPGVGWAIAAGGLALFITLKPFLDPEVKAAWKEAWDALMFKGGDPLAAIGTAAEATLEAGPLAWLLKWTDDFSITEWADSIVTPIENLFRGSAKDTEDAIKTGITGPMEDEFDRAAQEIVRGSIVPDMVERVLEWLQRMADDTRAPMATWADNVLDPMRQVMDGFDSLIGKIGLLTTGIRGLPSLPEDIALLGEGQFVLVRNDFRGSTWGAGVDPAEIDGMIHDAFRELV